ncbi:CB domain-containing protein [Pseudoscourfieldia marina]
MAENQSGAARMAQALRRSERLRLSGGAVRFSRAVEPTTPVAIQPWQIPRGSGRGGSLSRPISILLLPTTDLTADPDSAAHCVTVTRQHVKTDHGIDRNQPGRFPLSFPRRFAGLATALRNFTAARAAVYPTATHFFELPGERFTETTNFGDALGRMLGTALTTVSLQPPEGRDVDLTIWHLTSHAQ